jgi:hypothetical protein
MNKINNKQNNLTNNKTLANNKNLANNKGNSNKSNKNNSKKSLNINFDKKKIVKYIALVISFILLLLLVYLVVFLIKYLITGCYKKHSFFDYIKNRSFSNVCIHKVEPPKSQSLIKRKIENEKEVFHISNQDYTYNQAKCKCNAYGARLAKYPEVVNAYNNGAHWCNYGWTEGQNAYYPVQKNLWEESKEFCGKKPGINGGYFSNPHIKFGVNCYGIKPAGRVVLPKKPVEEQDFCSLKVNTQASSKLESDDISPFNETQWSAYLK